MNLEIVRALGALAEPPTAPSQVIADSLELGPIPDVARHTDLFAFQLYPFASVYLGPEGLLGGVARDRIAGFWRALGLVPPSEPDSLPVLLGAYADLAEATTESSTKSTGTTTTDTSAPGPDRANRARATLLWEHLLSWLPCYLRRVRTLDNDFYARWASLLDAVLAAEAKRFPAPPALPLHLREAPLLRDPRTDEGRELRDHDATKRGEGAAFLGELLAPVRTGMILTRDDLRRAARDLGLGSRIGERRFVLEALLGQAPGETLSWLGDEARRQARDLGRDATYAGAVATFWRQRGDAAADLLHDLSNEDMLMDN